MGGSYAQSVVNARPTALAFVTLGRMFSVSSPIEVLVLKDCMTEMKVT